MSVTVIKVGGAAVDRAHEVPQLWQGLVRLHQAQRIVIVHGGGGAVDELFGMLGIPVEKQRGIRVTPAEHVGHVVSVLAGSVSAELCGAINRAAEQTLAVGMTVTSAGLVCELDDSYGFDVGRVGRVANDAGEAKALHALLDTELLPVIACVGLDRDGLALNINGDDAAASVAGTIRADRLVLLTDVAGILDADGMILDEVRETRITQLIEDGTIHGGMIPKVRAAMTASAAARAPVVIASWKDPDVFDAIAQGRRVGTIIHSPISQKSTP
ncbi:MAG: acetylglutamate kinase [Planctomycetota bacterium]